MNVNGVNGINKATSINSLYNTLYEGNVALNSMRLNKSFLPTNKAQGFHPLGGDALQYVNNIKSTSKDLSSSLKELTSGSAFAKKTMKSSNEEVLTANYTDGKSSNAKDVTVKVKETAAGQLNEGARMQSKNTFGGSGQNTFSIEVNGKKTDFSIDISSKDTNEDVQQKMADAINKADIGVNATVDVDSKSGISMLKLESADTGNDAKNKFAVTGDLAVKTGIDEVSRDAWDAVYSVNGGADRTSKSNTVDLGGGLSATFNKASGEDVKISAVKDPAPAKAAVEKLVKNFNDLYIEGIKNSNDPKAENMSSKMLGISKTYAGSLSSIGIGFNNDGTMNIDTDKLNAAAESGKLEQFFTENSNRNYGFTNQLERFSNSVTQNTSNFVSRSTFGDSLTENFTYSGFGSLLQYNYFNIGSLFDYSY